MLKLAGSSIQHRHGRPSMARPQSDGAAVQGPWRVRLRRFTRGSSRSPEIMTDHLAVAGRILPQGPCWRP